MCWCWNFRSALATTRFFVDPMLFATSGLQIGLKSPGWFCLAAGDVHVMEEEILKFYRITAEQAAAAAAAAAAKAVEAAEEAAETDGTL
jgi:hypothetical protein